MYSHCLFCQAYLGRNEHVEHLQVGRALAYDQAKGRLWVVCPACRRWNLSPLEERWEAMEECERLFRGARLRASTENVGLARISPVFELIRVGEPLRPEMAAWRYGRLLLARRRAGLQAGAWAGGAVAAGVALTAAFPAAAVMIASFAAMGAALGGVVGGMVGLHGGGVAAERAPDLRRLAARLRTAEGEPLDLRGSLQSVQVRTDSRAPNGWELVVRTNPEAAAEPGSVPRPTDPRAREFHRNHEFVLHGTDALHAAAVVLRGANGWGASPGEVNRAVGELSRAPSAARYFAAAEEGMRREGWGHLSLWDMPAKVRLALEMAAHEEQERRAMEGELADLEKRWRQAEEIAAIADRLLVPERVERDIRTMRQSHR